jgi:hypothetical protein
MKISVDQVHNSVDGTWGDSLWTSGYGNARSHWHTAKTALQLARPRREELRSKGRCEEHILGISRDEWCWEGEVGNSFVRNDDGEGSWKQGEGGEAGLWRCGGGREGEVVEASRHLFMF